MVKRSRSTRDRERKDRIKVDLDKIRTLLPTCATDKKMPMHDVLQHALEFMRNLVYQNKVLGGDGYGEVCPDTEVDVEELVQLKKENEQLKSENMRFRSIIDGAGIPPHIDPAELVVTWRLRTHADMFSSSDKNALEPVSQSDTVATHQYEPYRRESDDAGADAGCVFTELLSAAELSATSSSEPIHPQQPADQQSGVMPCIVPPGLVYPNGGSTSMPFINQNGQLVFLPPASLPTNASSGNVPLLLPLSGADNPSLSSAASHVTTTQSSDVDGEVDADMPAVSSSTEEHTELPPAPVSEETGLVVIKPADSSVTESSSALASKSDSAIAEFDGQTSRPNAESASCLDGIEPVSPAEDVHDEPAAEPGVLPPQPPPSAVDDPTLAMGMPSLPSTANSAVVVNQPLFDSQPQQSFVPQQPAPMGMMPTMPSDQASSMQGTLVLHNGQLLLVSQNQPQVGSTHALPGSTGVNAVGPSVPQNMAVSGSGTIFVNQFPAAPQPTPQQQPAITPPMPPLGPNQTVMVNTPSGPMTLNTLPSQPNQHPSALILPNGQIVPVVTQPNLLFPPQQCTPVTGGLLIPTPPSQPLVNFVPPVSASPRMSSFTTTTPMPAPVVTVAAGGIPGAGMVRGLVQVPAGQQPGFPGSHPVQVGPCSVIQAVPAQGHMPLQASAQSTFAASTTATTSGPRMSIPNLPQTVMATMTPEGTIILTMPQTETQQKTGAKTKKSTVPRPLMPKPTVTPVKTECLTASSASATTTLNFLAPARLPNMVPPASTIMPVVSGTTYMVTNGPSVAGLNCQPLPTVANNPSITPLSVSLATDMVPQKMIEVSKTTDILAKATESIFLLSPSSGDHLSPSGLCLNHAENQLQIDVEGEHGAQPPMPNRSRSRSKKKPKMLVPLPPGHAEEIGTDHSILDQLEGGEGEDEQSDINDFSDLIRLEPMTPRPAPSLSAVIVKEIPAEKSAENCEENSADDSVRLVENRPATPPAGSEPVVPLQDSDDEEVVEIDLTEEPVSPSLDPASSPAIQDVVDEEPPAVEEAVEPAAEETPATEHELLSSSSKTLFERLEEALMSSSNAASSLASGSSSQATTSINITGACRSSRSPEKLSGAMPDSGKECELSAADKCASSTAIHRTVIDRIGKVLTMEKKSWFVDVGKKTSASENARNDNAECSTQPITRHDKHVPAEHPSPVKPINDISATKLNASGDRTSSEASANKQSKRSKKLKEKSSEPALTVAERALGSEIVERNDGKKPAADTEATDADGKNKGFALSNFLPESTVLTEPTSAADLLEQSLCMATDDRQKSTKNRSFNRVTDESDDAAVNDETVEPVKVPCMMEEATQTTRKELKKDKSKKQSHRASCNGISASEMPDTLTFNANELLNIVDVVENMAVETQTEKIKKSHRRKHKSASISNGEMEVPAKRKKKSSSSVVKRDAASSGGAAEKSRADSAEREREKHSKLKADDGANCSRAAMAPKNDPMDVFNFSSDDVVPLDVVSSYSPYRCTTKKLADENAEKSLVALPTSDKSSVSDNALDGKASRSREPIDDGHSEGSEAEVVLAENKENRGGTHKKLGHGSATADVLQTPPPKHGQPADEAEQHSSHEEVPSKSTVTARHSNIATLARHVVPPKMHGSAPRSATKLSAQAVRARGEPEVGDAAPEVITIPSLKVPRRSDDAAERQSSPVNVSSASDESWNVVDENVRPEKSCSSASDSLPDTSNEPPQVAREAGDVVETKSEYKTPVSCASDTGTTTAQQSDAVTRSQNVPVTVPSTSSSLSGSSLSHAAHTAVLPSTTGALTAETSTVHAPVVSSSFAVSHSEPVVADRSSAVQSCLRESSGALAEVGSRSCAKNSSGGELRDAVMSGYGNREENHSGRSSTVSNQSDSTRRHSSDAAGYEHGSVDRGYCENYAAGEVAARSRSSGGSCSVESRSGSSAAQASIHCERAANVSSLNTSSSLRSNCSQKASTSSDARHSRSSAASQVGGMYSGSMDCSAAAGTKHRSSCQEDSRQRQMMESDFFVPRAASSSSCAVQSNLAPSVVEPFQYPYAAMNGAQPQPHHHDMSLASIAAAEYGFGRNPFSSFPSPFGFDPQSSIRGAPGRFSPLSHNLPSCGVDKQAHKSAAGGSLRSGQDSSAAEISKSRHHQQQNMSSRDGYSSGFGHCGGSGAGQFLEPMPKDGLGTSRSGGHRLSSGSATSGQSMSAARRSRSPAVADRSSSYVAFGGLANSLTSPPLHHPPSTMPDRQCSARASSTSFELAPAAYHSPAAGGTQFSPNLTTVGFDPPPLNYSSVRDCASVGMVHGHSGGGGGTSKKTDKDSSKQHHGALQHKSPAAVAPAHQQPPKSSSNRSSSSKSQKKSSSSGKSTTQTAAPGIPMYDLDPAMFDSRCMTPYFGLGGGVSPNRGSLQGVQPSAADSLSYFSANIFGGAGRPLSNAAAKTLQHHRDAANPFNPFSPAGRATANGLGGLNFQPGTPGFGMEAHMAAAAATPMMPPHAPSAPGFGFGSLFADVGGVAANMADQHSTISPIKFAHHSASAQDPLHHQPSAYGGRTQHMLHDMGFNALLGGHHQHHGGAFDARAAAISSAMGPPFAGHHAAASFGMGALNFPMHNL